MSDEEIPEEILRQCFILKARALSRLITGIYAEALEGSGVTANQLTILAVVAQHPGLSASALGNLMHMEKSTVSRNIKRMLQCGFLLGGRGKRLEGIRLSAAGRRTLDRVYPRWQKAQQEALEILGPEGVTALNALGSRLFPLYRTHQPPA